MTGSEKTPRDTLITGIGLLTCLGEGVSANLSALTSPEAREPGADSETYAPYPVFPMVDLDLSQQIPRRADQRQMGPWQRLGVYAAGLALDDAGLTPESGLRSQTNLIVAAGGGERDPEADLAVLQARNKGADQLLMNETLVNNLRPTLFLAQLSNLLAGNISIVHSVTGSSRTFMGEEASGAMALNVAVNRIKADQGDLFLVGGAFNAMREDVLLFYEVGNFLWKGDPAAGVWQRFDEGGGLISGSMAAFLVLESRDHAERRGSKVYAELSDVFAESGPRDDPECTGRRLERLGTSLGLATEGSTLGYISGNPGSYSAGQAEYEFLKMMTESTSVPVRAMGTKIGHGLEAQMPVGVALAAAALHNDTFFPPFEEREAESEIVPDAIAVSAFGHWRGETVAIIKKAD